MNNVRFIGKIPSQSPDFFISQMLRNLISQFGVTQVEWALHRVVHGEGHSFIQMDAAISNLIASFGELNVRRIASTFGLQV